MKEFNEKMDSKKEYTAPQMEVMDCKVEGFLCNSDTVDVILDD
jgi:hypothetical protein